MRKRVYAVLCLLLTISLVWLPSSVTTNPSLFSKTTNHCHEMNTAMVKQAITNHSMNKSMADKDYCGHCDNNCDCTDISACSHTSSPNLSFIKFDLHFSHFIQPIQSITEYFKRYHNQIITPDIRPPIV